MRRLVYKKNSKLKNKVRSLEKQKYELDKRTHEHEVLAEKNENNDALNELNNLQ